MITRPMLAARARRYSELWFPCLGTPKLDGIRCVKFDGYGYSRAFKLIRNHHVQKLLRTLPDGLDGELMVDGAFQDVTSSIMSYDGTPEFEYHVFDYFGAGLTTPYYLRREALTALDLPPFVRIVPTAQLTNLGEFRTFEDACIAAEYEGVVTRSAIAPYKCGRSTLSEHYMVKWKQYMDSEALILGLVEANENTNPIVPNAFGLAKRPGGKGGKVPKGTLGAFQVRDVHSNVEFEIGTGIGLTTDLRQYIWNNQANYIGQTLKYRYQSTGVKDRPRFPSFIGFRHPEDM